MELILTIVTNSQLLALCINEENKSISKISIVYTNLCGNRRS